MSSLKFECSDSPGQSRTMCQCIMCNLLIWLFPFSVRTIVIMPNAHHDLWTVACEHSPRHLETSSTSASLMVWRVWPGNLEKPFRRTSSCWRIAQGRFFFCVAYLITSICYICVCTYSFSWHIVSFLRLTGISVWPRYHFRIPTLGSCSRQSRTPSKEVFTAMTVLYCAALAVLQCDAVMSV